MPTLLNRNVVIPHPDLNPDQKGQDLSSHTGLDYIINYITLMDSQRASKMGQKIFLNRTGTGGGKSTLIPPGLFKTRGKRIAITQPTRMTAESIPFEVVKYQKDLKMGENIGYQTGLINKSVKSGIIYMTTGILLQQILVMDPEQFMHRYSTLIIDEVHKHDLNADFLLRSLKMFYRSNWSNPDCPILILMSATIEPEKYLAYFETTNFLDIKGEDSQPIEEIWPEVQASDMDQAIVDCVKIILEDEVNNKDEIGDTLIFLPTVVDIKNINKLLSSDNNKDNIVEVYSAVNDKNTSGYKELFHPPKKNGRIILSTNAAETGITFPYLSNIIDTGMSFQVLFNPMYATLVMYKNWIAKANARQRRGRVGRIKKGKYYPMFTKEQYENLIDDPYPDMYATDISSYLLNFIVKYLEIKYDYIDMKLIQSGKLGFDPLALDLIHTPSSESLQLCFDKLYQLGLIDTNWTPTLSGYLVSRFRKLSIEQSKLILMAYTFDADIMGCIIISSCLAIGAKRLGNYNDLKIDIKDDKTRFNISDDFIQIILIYETIIEKMQHMSGVNPMKDLEKWFIENKLDYQGWLDVIELINEIELQLIEMGLRINYDRTLLIKRINKSPNEAFDDIIKIKRVLIESYRLNILTWNDIIKCYITNYKHNNVRCYSELVMGENPPKYILTDLILYKSSNSGQMSFNTGTCISVLDKFIDFDINFMY